jgi:Spy/CpxP family protein refolding chaperone
LFAAAFLAMLLTLGLGIAFAQDDQSAPPAQGQPSGEGMGRHMGRHGMQTVDDQLQNLTKKLNLTADQQAKLKPILEDQRAQMEKLHSDTSLSREDRFGKMQELRQNSDTQIKSVLNEDQQKTFDKMREEQHGHTGKWHKGGGMAPPANDSAPPPQQQQQQ